MSKRNLKSDRDNIAIRLVRFMQLAFLGESFRKKDLENEFGVGDRTIQRDLEALRVHGFEFKTKNGITHATALGVGFLNSCSLSLARNLGVSEIFPSFGENEITDLLNGVYKIDAKFEKFIANSTLKNDFKDICSAIKNHYILNFTYAQKPRTAKPYAFIFRLGVWYALCDEKGVLKTFTFEKISNLDVLEQTFSPENEKLAQIKENKNHWFSSAPVEAVLRLSITATAYLNHKQFFIKQKITKQDDKFAYLSVTAAFEDEILNFAKLYLPYVKIIEPANLQSKFEKILQDYLEKSANATNTDGKIS
ncbi:MULTISPECIES: helix-turn-helix transcriptional regulator [unclassified Campylobacter]|uniref:helix-turn-helix transcriptional regulator n=1 Tax=unclassified Campylobacter TaxID=2593542 RepID=UPI0022E9FE4B|nr:MULTISPECIES: WYL domain-containing protein [unclassified Campylobacter]MDA3056187.1 WYL domain-containing protein [Campylobacter sp. CN_NA1]MDA3065332.1 WYL domain-containing protein [Campylobacter sp. CN_NE4]MDA3068158.1 WYL domain-containing protein [Campylobacter sp. CN_NE3]MDA3082785.1 WYL domain-containing protein [Campylobacter sp. CN_EL2]MDA3083477.1 WYL domain-containing protein [Campylobacter sp. CN_NE1]